MLCTFFNRFFLTSTASTATTCKTRKLRVHLLLTNVNPHFVIIMKFTVYNMSTDLTQLLSRMVQTFSTQTPCFSIWIEMTAIEFYELLSAAVVLIKHMILQVHPTLVHRHWDGDWGKYLYFRTHYRRPYNINTLIICSWYLLFFFVY